MIHVVLGTKAQLIKMAPVALRLERRGLPYNLILTGQHRETIDQLRANFGVKEPDLVLYSGRDVTSIPAMSLWLLRILAETARRRDRIFRSDRRGIVLVHGDTFSTLLGALMGRVAGLRVGHVESGLRSFRLLHPFPEELTRLATFALCDHYFCPGPEAMANLARFDGVKVDLGGNTLYDALQEAIASRDAVDVPVPAVPYVVVTTHRFENIFVRRRLLQVLRLIAIVAERHRTLFILHPPTERVLRASGLYRTLESNPNVELHPRYDYFRFIRLVHGAEFVVSDGGSNQEETYYLGKPTLLLRSATERGEGLGETCVLSGYDEGVVRDFTAGYARYRRDPVRLAASPSDVLLDRIEEFA